MAEPSRLIDVSHTVEEGMVTYKGLPGPVIRDQLTRAASRRRYAPGTEFGTFPVRAFVLAEAT